MSNYDKYIKYKTKYLQLKGGDVKEIHVNEPWFTFIKDGVKKVEGRLNKGMFSNIKKDDTIIWFNIDKNTRQKRQVKTKVTKIATYKTFEDMLRTEELNNVLPKIKDYVEGVNVYRQWYDEQGEKKFGVLAIHLSTQD